MGGASVAHTRGRVVGPVVGDVVAAARVVGPVLGDVVDAARGVGVVVLVVGPPAPPVPGSPGTDAEATKIVPPSPWVLAVMTRLAPSSATNFSARDANGSKPRRFPPPSRPGRLDGPVAGPVVDACVEPAGRFKSRSPSAPEAANWARRSDAVSARA